MVDDNSGSVAGEKIVALCNVNDKNLASAAARFPGAKKYHDWRELLQQKDLDAVVISTPDHVHAPAALAAMKLGKHVYCEKPLAHSVYEARLMRNTRNQTKVATQMGTQIHATENYRRMVELIQAGAIGPVREVHVWCDRVGNPPGTGHPKDTQAPPPHIHWDLWLGPARERPYSPSYFGGCTVWEQYWDYGNGCLGDMGSHLIDLPFWALKLRQPLTAEAQGSHHSEECYPQWLIARWEHPATSERPGLVLTWYDGGKRPPALSKAEAEKRSVTGIGVFFVGDRGQLLADYSHCILLPEAEFKDFRLAGKQDPGLAGPSRGMDPRL